MSQKAYIAPNNISYWIDICKAKIRMQMHCTFNVLIMSLETLQMCLLNPIENTISNEDMNDFFRTIMLHRITLEHVGNLWALK